MLRSLTSLVCGALAVTLLASPSPAATRSQGAAPPSRVVLTDGRDDVWMIGPGEDTWHFFGSKPAVDFERATGEHGARAVTATMRFVNLRRLRPMDFTVRVRSDEGFRRAIVSTRPGRWAGTHRLLDRSEQQVPCPRLRHDVDYGRDRVVVRIPRRCLGEPAWVRLAISAYFFRRMSTLSDNPHNAEAEPTYTHRLSPPAA